MRWLIKRPRWNRAFLPQPRSDQRSQTALTKGVCNEKANQPGQECPIQIKISTGHDEVKSCTWSHHLILTTHRKRGPHPVIVLTPISPVQLWTSTWECAVTCTGLPYTSAFCIMVTATQAEDRSVWARSTSCQLTLSKSKRSIHANSRRTSSFFTSPLYLKS